MLAIGFRGEGGDGVVPGSVVDDYGRRYECDVEWIDDDGEDGVRKGKTEVSRHLVMVDAGNWEKAAGKILAWMDGNWPDHREELWDAFRGAAGHGHVDCVREIGKVVSFALQFARIDKEGLSRAMRLAAIGGHIDVVKLLMSDIEAGDLERVVDNAVRRENAAILRSVLELMEDRVAELFDKEWMLDRAALDYHHGSPLYDAARYDRIEALEFLLTHGISPNNLHNEVPPLLVCSTLAAVQLLLSHGANPNASGRLPWRHHEVTTPLGRAAAIGNPPAVKALLDAGADPRAEDDHALCCAIKGRPRSDLECVDMLLGTFPPNTPIPDKVWAGAAESGKVDIFNRFLAFDPPTPPRAGAHVAALHLAAEKGHDSILQALRDAGVEMVDGMVEAEKALSGV
ncbi:hypothetical protein HK104_008919 [Borealophlyctis nickersoniae]|nr:hypothetical protein HK104_008919 [Borealophlyctis nickersoniae]